jgi:uncharacterized repeat protein (TIGR01451 family)
MTTTSGCIVSFEKIPLSAIPAGGGCTYEIVVHGFGPRPAFQVRLEDQLPPDAEYLGAEPRPERQGDRLSWDLGRLEPDAERRFKVELRSAHALGSLPAASVSFSTAGGESPHASPAPLPAAANPISPLGGPSDTTVKPGPTAPLVVKTTGPESVAVGETVVFQIEVTNTGSTPVSGLVLRDHLPAGLQHSQGNDIEADLPNLAPGETRKVSLSAVATAAGRQVNETEVRGADGSKATGQAAVLVVEPITRTVARSVEPAPGVRLASLNLEVSNKDSQAEVGVESTYDVRVVNRGNLAGTGIQVLATVPDGMEPLSGQGPTRFRVQRQQVVFEPLARLEPGKEALYRVKVRCHSAGDWRFKAQLTSDQLRLPLCKEEGTRVYNDRN